MPPKLRTAWIDSKEINNHPEWAEDGPNARHIPGTFLYEGMRPVMQAHQFGDIHVQLRGFKRLVIELKTWADLHASVRDTAEGRADTRLRHQLTGLLQLQGQGATVAILLVGTITPAGGKTPVGKRARGVYLSTGESARSHRQAHSWFEYESTRATIQSLGVLTFQSPSIREIPHSVRLLAELVERETVLEAPGLPRITTLGPRHSFLVTQLTGIQGVGIVDASAIAQRYGTFETFFRLGTVDDLVSVKGIGKPTAQKIFNAFHGEEPDPPPKPLNEQNWIK